MLGRRWTGLIMATVVLFAVAAIAQMPAGTGADGLTRMPQRYYVKSLDPLLMRDLGVHHRFQHSFSTNLAPGQVVALQVRGIEVEPVGLFHIVPKPSPGACNDDGTCQGWEDETSCGDCAGGGEDPPGETPACLPDDPTPWGIEAVYSDPNIEITSGGLGVTVAVLDSGVNTDHLDLAGRVGECIDTTRRGIKRGCRDSVGHGTHVAGTILADGGADGQGIYGIAPEATLMAIKVCGAVFCWGDDISEGILYAADHGADIISMSLGGDGIDFQMALAIYYAVSGLDLMVVAAAGNDGPALGSIDFPGGYAEVVGVGAVDWLGNTPYWSSRGSNNTNCDLEDFEVEFSAPGVSVLSTYNDGCYTTMSGTSMATPHVSGLAAKLWQGTGSTTRSFLRTFAPLTCPTDPASGYGFLQLP